MKKKRKTNRSNNAMGNDNDHILMWIGQLITVIFLQNTVLLLYPLGPP